jgi:hypothetical protein
VSAWAGFAGARHDAGVECGDDRAVGQVIDVQAAFCGGVRFSA